MHCYLHRSADPARHLRSQLAVTVGAGQVTVERDRGGADGHHHA
jgi:hypothetical protein